MFRRCLTLLSKSNTRAPLASVTSMKPGMQPEIPLWKRYGKRYGAAMMATHWGCSQVTFFSWFVAIKFGVNPDLIFSHVIPGYDLSSFDPIAQAFVANKLSSPLRFPFSVVLTPVVSAKLEARNCHVEHDITKSNREI